MSTNPKINPTFTDSLLETAYNAAWAEMDALPHNELFPINVDLLNTATKATRCSPRVQALRSQIVSQLPEFDVGQLDKLHGYALALIYAHALRNQTPSTVQRTADARARAFTLLARSYNDVRRAVIYLRWYQGDADVIAPSSYAGRDRGGQRAS